jgi:predicted metal-dependent HD superfamily phosphohydrolase
MIDRASWSAAWRQLGARDAGDALHRQLIACWSERHRHYHTLQHLRECLDHLDAARALARDPAQIAVALWFHDAFYDATRQDNEQRSADWARDAAMQAGITRSAGDRLHAMILATKHEAAPQEGDTRLLVDIDLAILGADPARFDESGEQVRREYAHVPEDQWRIGRGRVLRHFLERDRLYNTQRFHDMFEAQARQNIRRALQRLGS